ncbi:hypothetical protein HMPREF1125_1180 [Streptococcus oralis SK304]|uniref:Uncharacterized protein n=1 Tax=Streptococcus oralis SK304 TaxID=1161421 RepID=J4TI09_STROR|nr:hypothetical protein [Streptococcus oralis]EJP19803.1 hypothetical protein HMPREF1125_1231 [Streptococcus oralis SK304]EJP23284.1 hypothetical protein HMPREF1125_1180 [Streptococcus oralis SK304]
MAKNKIKLTSSLSLKEVALESSQFDIPKKIQVDFSKVTGFLKGHTSS